MNTVNVLLTEIALNLLGNSFYDINGEPVDDLQSLYKNEPRAPNPEKQNLAELLGIFGSETAANVPSASSATPTTSEDVITLEDDDDDGGLLSTPYQSASEETPEVFNEPPVQSASPAQSPSPAKSASPVPTLSTASTPARSTTPKAAPVPLTTKVPVPLSNKAPVPPSSKATAPPPSAAAQNSANANSDSDLEEIECEEYESADPSVRLNFIAKQTDNEFNRMKANVRKQKRGYENGNRNLIALLKLKPRAVWKRFFDQQRQELIDESNSLMQFIRAIKNSDSINQKVLSKVAKDILVAKDTVP